MPWAGRETLGSAFPGFALDSFGCIGWARHPHHLSLEVERIPAFLSQAQQLLDALPQASCARLVAMVPHAAPCPSQRAGTMELI